MTLQSTQFGEMEKITNYLQRTGGLLRAAVGAILEGKFGFKSSEIGTRSLRSGVAMATFLDEISTVCTIMIIGRWSSDAFLKHTYEETS